MKYKKIRKRSLAFGKVVLPVIVPILISVYNRHQPNYRGHAETTITKSRSIIYVRVPILEAVGWRVFIQPVESDQLGLDDGK